MEEENKDIFDEAVEQSTEELSVEVKEEEKLVKQESSYEIGELSDAESYEIELKPEDETVRNAKEEKNNKEGKVFEIETVELGKPDTSKGPLSSEDGKEFFKTKLKITYKDSDYMSILPNIKWYVGERDGKKVLNPWFLRTITEDKLEDPFISEVSKLYYRYCKFVNQEVGKVTAKDFVQNLPKMSVKLKNSKGTFKNKNWSRIDIVEFC